MKLEVGMYIRTDDGIRRIIGEYDEGFELNRSLHYLYPDGHDLYKEDLEELEIKASHNIIDLIEVGDYVNGHEVKSKQSGVKRIDIGEDENYVWLNEKDIKSVITHEQMEQMAYKVGE